jgi:hypothetical protein
MSQSSKPQRLFAVPPEFASPANPDRSFHSLGLYIPRIWEHHPPIMTNTSSCPPRARLVRMDFFVAEPVRDRVDEHIGSLGASRSEVARLLLALGLRALPTGRAPAADGETTAA